MEAGGPDSIHKTDRVAWPPLVPKETPGGIFTFLADAHPLSSFMAERSSEIAGLMSQQNTGLTPSGVDLKVTAGAEGTWRSQRLVRQFSDAAGGAIAIWSRKAGGTALWRFPDDPYLPGLAEWWRNPRDADGRSLTGLKVLRYVPTRRVTISAELEFDRTAGRIIVKFKRSSKIEHSAAMLEAVYDAARVQDPKLAIARPLGMLDEVGAFCQAFLDVAPFDEAVTAENLDDVMRHAGKVHARLHALDVKGVPRWSRARYIETIADDISWVSYMLPRFGPALRAAGPRICSGLERAASSREVFCHGDFVPGQLLYGGRTTAVTDFDMARTGLDLQEIAKWIASLKYHIPLLARTLEAEPNRGVSLMRRAEAIYLEGYSGETGETISSEALLPFTAAAEVHYLGVRLKKGLYSEIAFRLGLEAVLKAVRETQPSSHANPQVIF